MNSTTGFQATPVRTIFLTLAAMLAFAANSILCRLALGQELIGAASFTSVRLTSGAVVLILIALARGRFQGRARINYRSVFALFTYMTFFSFAYQSLGAGTGALILFAAVQLTMFIVALRDGESFPLMARAGLLLAFAGLVYLVSPGLTSPDPTGALMMAVAGMAWGFYSLLGRKAADPLAATTSNFVYCVPPAVAVNLLFVGHMAAQPVGVMLAIASGAIASGIGYVIWYAALPGLAATRAAIVQLSVPVIAAIGGVVLLAEPPTLRLALASAITLGGVALVLLQRQR